MKSLTLNKQIIIADTSSLIAFSNIGQLILLKLLYNKIFITPEIFKEFEQEVPEWIIIKKVQDKQKLSQLKLDLDSGEASGITLALEQIPCTLIIDKKKVEELQRSLAYQLLVFLEFLCTQKKREY